MSNHEHPCEWCHEDMRRMSLSDMRNHEDRCVKNPANSTKTLTEMLEALPHTQTCTYRELCDGPIHDTIFKPCDCGLDEAIAQAQKADAVIAALNKADKGYGILRVMVDDDDVRQALADYNGTKETDK